MFADHSRIFTGDTSTSSPTLAAMMMLVMRTLSGAAPRWRSGRCLTTESSSASRSPSSPSRAREMTMRRTVRRNHPKKTDRCSNCWWKCVFLILQIFKTNKYFILILSPLTSCIQCIIEVLSVKEALNS